MMILRLPGENDGGTAPAAQVGEERDLKAGPQRGL